MSELTKQLGLLAGVIRRPRAYSYLVRRVAQFPNLRFRPLRQIRSTASYTIGKPRSTTNADFPISRFVYRQGISAEHGHREEG